MRLVFAGTPEVAVPALDALVASQHDVVAVVTRPDAPAGRGRKLSASPVALRAMELGIEVLKPTHPREAEFQQRLRELAPDACPVVAYGALLPQSALDIPRFGWINLHFSLLPRWRGAAPVQRAIMAGDEYTGTSCFRIVRELDAGDVYDLERVPLLEETAGELLARLAHSGATQLVRVMDAIADGAVPTPQPDEGVTLAAKLSSEEARINFAHDPVAVRNHILGCSPDPGAWCEHRGNRLKVYRAAVAKERDLAPGELRVTKKQVFVGVSGGSLELLEVQAPGKKRMPAIDWARGGVQGVLE
ncbi:methionyl-tRNA formyltransferase [Tessaracoccus sp. OH4464_COT-324]|uniref:methionyl-tRNA formyltransferase n=1 Tax=Tessaracoccus sp. OH4464_COT-324 TaxID=2491059 RepID=UPI000F6413FD|nr:methionyl-tRNA formyltransferase [Tessaracoccus sp. OH4464_COT-324]RRD47979.1 methionyl-tRNA formyltransferase [Tessaracoccus sp. OH4464_COT-324]